jgi:hypothetical protein
MSEVGCYIKYIYYHLLGGLYKMSYANEITTTNDFFPKFLSRIADAFDSGSICIIDCEDKNTGEPVKVLAVISINEVNRKIEFRPIATLFNSNPKMAIKMASEDCVLATQVSLDEWQDEADSKPPTFGEMN